MWQDTVIALCQLAFLPAFIPTLRGKDKPAAITSASNAVIVAIMTATLATLRLWLAVITAAMICAVWVVLAVQKVRMDRARPGSM